MRTLRRIHLYLGCVFTPILLFFAVSGGWQLFELHQRRKNSSYQPPEWLRLLSEIHLHQRWENPSFALKLFVLAAAFGFVLTSLLGVVMALKASPRKGIVWGCLALGALLPVLLLIG